jgi:hypothetical protein
MNHARCRDFDLFQMIVLDGMSQWTCRLVCWFQELSTSTCQSIAGSPADFRTSRGHGSCSGQQGLVLGSDPAPAPLRSYFDANHPPSVND